MKKLLSFVFILLCGLSLVACNNGKASYDAESSESYKASSTNTESNIVIDTNQKLVYTVSIKMNSQNIEAKIQGLNTKAKELEGYAGESSISYDSDGYAYGYIEFRVPTEKLDTFIDYISNEHGYESKTVDIDDITSQYSETEARLETLTASKEAYTASLASATTASERITILDKIEDIDTEIAKLQKIKAAYDNDINYSTVKISFSYSSTTEEEGFFSQYFTYFGNFFKYLGIAILYLVPFGIIGGVIFSCIYFPIKYSKKKKELNE